MEDSVTVQLATRRSHQHLFIALKKQPESVHTSISLTVSLCKHISASFSLMGLARTLRVIHGSLLSTFTKGPCGLDSVVSKCFSELSSGMVTFIAFFCHQKGGNTI